MHEGHGVIGRHLLLILSTILALLAIGGSVFYAFSASVVLGLVTVLSMGMLLLLTGVVTLLFFVPAQAHGTSEPSLQPLPHAVTQSEPAAAPPPPAFDADNLVKLLDDTLALARGEPVLRSREAVDVRALLEAIAGKQSTGRLMIYGPAEPLYSLADGSALQRLFETLVDTSLDGATSVKLRLDYGTSALVVHVDDNGPGIPRSQRTQIFDPVYRTEHPAAGPYGGRGPELAIAERIARTHGGRITVAASPEGGARFTVQLPLLRAHEREVELQAAS